MYLNNYYLLKSQLLLEDKVYYLNKYCLIFKPIKIKIEIKIKNELQYAINIIIFFLKFMCSQFIKIKYVNNNLICFCSTYNKYEIFNIIENWINWILPLYSQVIEKSLLLNTYNITYENYMFNFLNEFEILYELNNKFIENFKVDNIKFIFKTYLKNSILKENLARVLKIPLKIA